MRNVTMDNPLTTQEIYDELFNFKESLKNLADDFGELANGIMLSLAKKPSADRPRGKWKRNKTYTSLVFCSECGMPYEEKLTPKDFCPSCGADMRGNND